MKKTTMLRGLLAKGKIIVAPAAYDCTSAIIIEKLGFDAVFLSGFSLSASLLGNPDIGTETRTETVTLARNVAASVDIPVFVDASSGYGGPLSVYQTIQELERAGVAGCFIEDQAFPPICPFIGTPNVISKEEFLPKLRAALDAREDKDFVVIARTDAAATLGVEEALKRGKAYREAGADAILPTAGMPRDKEGLRQFIDALKAPVMVPPSWDLGLTVKDYEEIGVNILSGMEAIFAAAKAVEVIYSELRTTGFVKEEYCHKQAIPEFAKLLKLEKWTDLDKKYRLP
jgi:methylisocitrate lyase